VACTDRIARQRGARGPGAHRHDRGSFERLGAWIELRDVVLLDPVGRTALRLPQVIAALSARSLVALELRFEQLLIDGPSSRSGAMRRAAFSSLVSIWAAAVPAATTALRPTGSSGRASS
jgi:hypothetical protein